MELHAKFSPSQMERYVQCHGSWAEFMDREERVSTPAAERGIKLHAYVVRAYKDPTKVMEIRDKEDREAVLECLDYLAGVEANLTRMHGTEFERRVSCKKWGMPDLWGTADVVLTDPKNREVHVIDWKFGRTPVSVVRNVQGMCYLLGAAAEYDYDNFFFHVGQPMHNYFKAYEVKRKELLDYGEDVLKGTIVGCLADRPKYSPSTKACQYCVARLDCGARTALSIEVAKKVFEVKRAMPRAKMEDVVGLLDDAEILIQHVKYITEWAEGAMLNGEEVPGYKLIHGKRSTNRSYTDKELVIDYLLDRGADPEKIFKTTLRTPTQIEKEFKEWELKRDKTYQDFIAPGKRPPKIAREDDPAPPYNRIDVAAKIFAEEIKKSRAERG